MAHARKDNDKVTLVDDDGICEDGSKYHVEPVFVLAGAKAAKLERVLVIGVKPNGEFYAAGSDGTGLHLKDIEAFHAKLKAGTWE